MKLLVISAGVRLEPDYVFESVEPKIRAALLAGFAVDVRELGQPAYLSEAIGMMQAVEGVASVDPQVFDAVSETVTVKALSQLAGTLTLHASIAADLARQDPAAAATSAADPCARIRPAELVFLTPYIPDTLILTEIGA